MLKKTVCLTLTAALLLLAGCAKNEPAGSEMKTLAEIRAEKENIVEIAKKYDNLDLSKTYFYVPDVDKIENFSILFGMPIEDKEKLLLETANWVIPGSSNENDILYFTYDAEYNFVYIPYSDCKNDPQRGELDGLFCRNDKLDVSINIGGSWILAANNAVDDLVSTSRGTPRYIDGQDPAEEYNHLAGDTADARVELQDGEMLVSDTVEILKSNFENSPLNIDELKLTPRKTGVYNVGKKYGVCTYFLQEYNGVLLDYHIYDKNIETGELEDEKKYVSISMAMVWKNQTDQLYGADIISEVKPSGDSFEEFVSLESFISMMSQKLTGGSRFAIDTVELLYEVDNILPDNYSELSFEEKALLHHTGRFCHPMWVAYISNSGITDAPQMCVTADAVTGEFNLYRSWTV
ncbi:MAG: hypothetical protein K2J77_07485 [Oscillospiraceae bacterium]|nr:hypothetical protein [Oscillospiraceae bacterium]